jgi:RimJ/RimL family protein N-acetyltransferase
MGFTWLERSSWGQGYNEDSKLALLHHCFDTMGFERVEWQVDAQNERSIAALTRMGFVFEGRLRSRHIRPDGSRRDSLYFSVLAQEWPDISAHLAGLVGNHTRE